MEIRRLSRTTRVSSPAIYRTATAHAARAARKGHFRSQQFEEDLPRQTCSDGVGLTEYSLRLMVCSEVRSVFAFSRNSQEGHHATPFDSRLTLTVNSAAPCEWWKEGRVKYDIGFVLRMVRFASNSQLL